MLQRVLQLTGYETSVAYSGADGVSLAKARPPDILVCDLGLPGLDGFAVAKELRSSSKTKHVRLIALSGYGKDEDKRRALEAEFECHITKPVALELLLKQLEELAGTSPPARESE